MSKRKKKIFITLIILIICFITIPFYLYYENNSIEITHLDVYINDLPSLLQGLKIIQISDTHIPKNASNIENILDMVRDNSPDIILMTGDIMDEDSDISSFDVEEFCLGLIDIAPVYSVYGNHELWNSNLEQLDNIYSSSGIIMLNNEFTIFTYNGSDILLIGLSDAVRYNSDNFVGITNHLSLPVIMLAHHPELADTYSSSNNLVIPDLVFSGHAHGGQFRLPVIGGLLAPDQGLFPKYDNGLYLLDNNCQMFVSRGLGNSIFPFRINNRPQLPIITLKSS